MAVFAIVNNAGQLLQRGQTPMTQLKQWAESQLTKQDQVVVEATGNSFHVYDLLSPVAGEVVIANALAMHDRTQARRKTDKVDALALAIALSKDYIPEVWVPTPEIRQKRESVSHRQGLSKNLTALRNQLRGLLYRWGLDFQGPNIFSAEAKTFIEEVDVPPATQSILLSKYHSGQTLLEEIRSIDRQLSECALKDEVSLKLTTLPGIGAQTALIVTSAIGDIHRFSSPKKLTSYAGLVPSVHQSADTVHYGPITKQGRNLLRWAMVEAANAAVLTPGPIQDRYERLRRKGKIHVVAVVAIARYLLGLIWYLLTRNQVFRDAKPKYLKTKFQGMLRKAYGKAPRNAASVLANSVMGWTPAGIVV